MTMTSSRLPMSTSLRQPRHGRPTRHVDMMMLMLTLAIVVFGNLAVYSAGQGNVRRNKYAPRFYLLRQGTFTVVGLVLMAGVMLIDYRKLRDWAWIGYIGVCGMLILVVSKIGQTSKGAQSWFGFGSFQIQPSEFAKIVMIVVLAAFLSVPRTTLDFRRLLVALAIAGFPVALVMLQPDLGTSMVFGVITVLILVVGGLQVRHFLLLTFVVILGIGAIVRWGGLQDFQIKRFTAFTEQSSALSKNGIELSSAANNLKQSKIAIGSGGVFGQGYRNGSQTKGGFVPEQNTDFIFSAVAEEFGFVGAGGLLVLFGLLIWRIWRTSQLASDLFGTLLCTGVLGLFMFQIFENVGMGMGIMPITGIPLPFVSYGGSAMIAYLMAIGLVLNVHSRRYR